MINLCVLSHNTAVFTLNRYKKLRGISHYKRSRRHRRGVEGKVRTPQKYIKKQSHLDIQKVLKFKKNTGLFIYTSTTYVYNVLLSIYNNTIHKH